MIYQVQSYVGFVSKAKHKRRLENAFLKRFAANVLDKNKKYYAFMALELVRDKLLLDKELITVSDLGVGSKKLKANKRRICDIAKLSLKKPKFAEILFRLINDLQPCTVLELGTSLGITTGYMAKANKKAKVYTLEGCSEIAKVAKTTLTQLNCKNVELLVGSFDHLLPDVLKKKNTFDLIFIDGNHSKDATLRYFNMCLPHLTDTSIIVFDDIHWSKGMNEAWNEISNSSVISFSIDLFEMGIIFFNKNTGVKDKCTSILI